MKNNINILNAQSHTMTAYINGGTYKNVYLVSQYIFTNFNYKFKY